MNPRPALRLPSLLGLAGLALARLLSAQVERVDELRFPVLPPLAIPTVERHALANGMVVLFAPDHELGLVSATLMLPTGTASEPAEKVGLVRLGAELLRTGGAGERSADELDELLDAHGAEIATEADPDSLTVELSCLAPDFPQMLGVLADLLRRPRFAPDRLEIARGQLEAEIARQNDDPGQITGRELDEILYGEASPYARQATYATLGAIRREDLLAWQAQQLHPNGLVMGLSGDFDPAQALKLLEIAFGGWPKGPAQPRRRIDQFPAPKPGVYQVALDDVNQSSIAMGYFGLRKDNPDYYAVEVLNQVLGGGLGSRLFSNVRSKKGLGYSVGGRVGSAYNRPGEAYFSLLTKTATTGAGIAAVLGELDGMLTSPPSAEEIGRAKESILNSFIFRFDSPRRILVQKLLYEFYGYPSDWLEKYRTGLEGVTAQQVAAAARKYLRTKDLAILVVGPSQGLDRPLSDFGPVTQRDISIPPPPEAKP